MVDGLRSDGKQNGCDPNVGQAARNPDTVNKTDFSSAHSVFQIQSAGVDGESTPALTS